MFILTEKASVAQAMVDALGGFAREKGGWYANSTGDCIVAAQGHLLELYEPEDYDPSLKTWSLDSLPIIPSQFRYKPIAANAAILKRIRHCFDTYDSTDFILATDAEREGELIGALILDYVHFRHYDTARRFWVSEALTPEVVRRGIQDAKPLSHYTAYKEAGYARQQADWLLGMNCSRLLTCSARKLLTFGRVQSAILGAIYLRDKGIANFKPVPYWQFQIEAKLCNVAQFSEPFSMLMLFGEGDRVADRSDSNLRAAEKTIAQGATLTTESVTSEEKKENPPQLFNITGLQKHCSERFKLTPAKTLEIAQQLYEELKCLSYPRTPSVVLGDENIDVFKEKYNLLSKAYTKLAEGCDETNISAENKRIFNSKKLQDHHALIPLAVLPASATEEQKQVYFAVAERFFQTIKRPFIYKQTKIIATKDGYRFHAEGRTVIDYGWKDKDDTDGKESASLPPISQGDTLTITKAATLQKETQPKKHFTNASVLSLMENPKGETEHTEKLAGLGTPATRAEIIESLKRRNYIKQEKQSLVITELGTFLIETILEVPELKKLIAISTTTAWEQQLQDSPASFLSGITSFTREEVPKMRVTREWQPKDLGACPLCSKGKVFEGKKAYFCSEYKSGCKFIIWKSMNGANITPADATLLASGKQTRPKKMTSKAGKEFTARLSYSTAENKVTFAFDKAQKRATLHTF